MRLINLTMLSLSFVITACGGGGGGEETTVEPSNPTTTVIIDTASLVAPDQFDYQTSRDVHLVVEFPSLTEERAFVSVFSEYKQTASLEWRPDFDSRILIESLQDGRLERDIMVTNDINHVLLQLWTDNAGDAPYEIELPIDNDEIIWNM